MPSDKLMEYLFSSFTEVFNVDFCMKKVENFLVKQIHEMKIGIRVVSPDLSGKH